MVDLLLIGIGAGHPDHLTGSARQALAQADLVLIPFKGEEKSDLAALRHHLVAQFRPPNAQVACFDMPVRDPSLPYLEGVDAWHDAIAAQWADAIAAHPSAERIALLVWGDPSLYDSTLRIAGRLKPLPRVRVFPGLTSLQLLTAAHAIPLNTLGGEVLITTGRKLKALGWPDRARTVAVMLDGDCAFRHLDAADLHIWWGAYLGMQEERLVSGPLRKVGKDIMRLRAAARDRNGWIMDTYLLRDAAAERD
jgi:precorrin-6A synthase